jgi:hypothetical protein
MGSRNPRSAKYTGGMQSRQSLVLCSDIVESEETRVDAQSGPGSLVMKGSGVRVSPSALREDPTALRLRTAKSAGRRHLSEPEAMRC